MDAFLVRKRPFAEHEARRLELASSGGGRPRLVSANQQSAKRPRHSANDTRDSSRDDAAAAARSRMSAPRSAAASWRGDSESDDSLEEVADSDSQSSNAETTNTRRTSGGGTIITKFNPSARRSSSGSRQMTIDQMKKVTDIDSVSALHSVLSGAIGRADWSRVLTMLQQLEDIFITKQVLSSTGIGVTVAKLKKINKGREDEDGTAAAAAAANTTTSAESPPANAVSAPPTAPAAAAAVDLTEESHAIDLTAEDHSVPPPATCPLSPASSVVSLATRLITTWRLQVKKEESAARIGGDGSHPSLIFDDYSTLRARNDTYKSLYYRLTVEEARETSAQKAARRAACKSLEPKDLPSARLAAEIEYALFKYHLSRQQERLAERNRRFGAELLSATPTNGEEDSLTILTHAVPPAYTPHARALLLTITEPAQLTHLRAWRASHEDGAQPTREEDERRREMLQHLVQRTKQFG